MLRGDLALFSLGEIFQSLAINSHTGTLVIQLPGEHEKKIYFRRGEIAAFCDEAPSARVPKLGEVLVRMHLVSAAQLEEALKEQRGTGKLLGEVLLSAGAIREEELHTALRNKALEGLYDLFLLKAGTFEFHMNEVPKEVQDDTEGRWLLALSTNSVIMEGLRQVDEWTLIHQKIATFDEIFFRIGIPEEDPSDPYFSFYDQINGILPVRDLFKVFPGNRFQCCKLLTELLEKGIIRALSEDECLEAAAKRVEFGQHAQAADFLLCAAGLNPGRAETFVKLGEAFVHSYQTTRASAAYVTAIQLFFNQEDFARVAALGDELLPKMELGDDELEKLFCSYIRLQNFKRATSAGNLLAASLQRRGRFDKAAEIVEGLCALVPKDLNLKIQLATVLEKAGEKEKATQLLEGIAAGLEKERKLKELLKVQRLLHTMHPDRADLKQKVTDTQILIEQLAKRRKYRITIAGATFIGLMTLVLVPILYELKAREQLGHAQRIEAIAMLSQNFQQAKSAYLELLKNYGFSTKVAEAQSAIDRISGLERDHIGRQEVEVEARKREQHAKLAVMKDELSAALKAAEQAEDAGDIEKAFTICKRVATEYAEIPAGQSIHFPLRVTSEPPGARIVVDGVEIGTTPVVCRYKAGTKAKVKVTRSSCEDVNEVVLLQDQWNLHYKLKRKAMGELSPSVAIHQSMVVSGNKVLVPTRDGNLYGLDVDSMSVVWQKLVGRFGDRISDLTVAGEDVFFGTVTGEVTALNPMTGKSRWVARVGSAVHAAPAISPDRRVLAIGTLGGTVHLLNAENGAAIAKLETENEIVARPLFVGDTLFVGSTDNMLYAFIMTPKPRRLAVDLADDVVLDLVAKDGAIYASTSNGAVHCLSVDTMATRWSKSMGRPVSAGLRLGALGIILGTEDGRVCALDPRTGDLGWEIAAGAGAPVGFAESGKMLYTCFESGKLIAFSLDKRGAAWEYAASLPLASAPLFCAGKIFISSATGKVQYLEAFE